MPEETVTYLEAILGSRYDYWMHDEKVSDELYWSAMFLEDVEQFRAMGKGTSAMQSRAGALAEGAETLTARKVEELPGYRCAHQDGMPNPVPIQAFVAHIATATPPVLEKVLELDASQHWVDAVSLMDGRTVQVPIEYIYQIGGPNGRASGNRIEEAIVHAVNEIFERRAHITVLKNRMTVPTIDIETIQHPVIREQIRFVQERGIRVTLKDLSFGGVLPCIGAYFYDPHIPEAYQFHHFFKVGAGFDTEEALLRVFTEYTQGRKEEEFIGDDAETRDRLLQHDFRALPAQPSSCDNFMSTFMFGFVPYEDAGFLEEGELVPFAPQPGFENCLEDIEQAKAICSALGKDLLVVDWSDPEIDFSVAQVIIPGYSDVLPYHPSNSTVLFEPWTRDDVLHSYKAQ